MKKLSNKIKSIYTLTAILVLSLCMLLFPATSNPASAEEISDAANSITINSVYVQVSKDVEDTEFVLMFKAKIDLSTYNVITNNGQDNVKFGMLIGQTEKMINVSDYQTAIAQDFVQFSQVGTRSSGAFQQVEFRQSEEYFYSAGIIYNKQYIEEQGQKLNKDISLKELVGDALTAIPFYTIDGTPYAIMGNQKSCVPREILAESYIKEQDEEITNIPENIITTYVGEVQEMPGEHYVCRDTARFMSTNVVGGDLEPTSIATAEDAVFISGKKYTSMNTLELQSELLDNFPMYAKTNFVVYKADGSIYKYSTKVAERVITRFSDVSISDLTIKEDKIEYPSSYDDTPDYLSKVSASITEDEENGNYISANYTSIFNVKNGNVKYREGSKEYAQITTRSVVLRALDVGYEGLYVLGKNITLPSSHNYVTDTGSVFSAGSGYKANATGSDADLVRVAYAPPTAYVGFNATFDGRGHSIDMQERAVNGVLPPAFDATIKNTAFYGLQTNINGGGITSHARLTTFENIYAEVTKATTYSGDLNKGILMNIQDCDIKNFVAVVNTITDDVMTGDLPAFQATTAAKPNGSGVGQGVTTAGVFSFRSYPDAYYDANINMVRIANSSAQFSNAGLFVDNISLIEAQRLFPNMIDKNEKPAWALYNAAVANNYKVAPLAEDYQNMLDPSQATAFTGSTGVNVYAVGSSPLYVGYDYFDERGGTSSTNPPGTQLKATATATVFVNQAPKLTNGQDAEVNWKQDGTSYLAPTAYKMSDIDDESFAFAEDTTYTLGEIIYRGKLYRHGATRMTTLLNGSQAKDVLQVRFINQEGFYDVASMDDMKSYVLAQETPFDSLYWNVGTDGSVAWKNPIVKAN